MADLPRATVFPSTAEFRAWLEANHDTASELWVGFYKKGVPKTSVSYPDAVEEGLCFGWIDGLTRRIDDEVYAIRFTPRTKRSSWSAANVAKMEGLIGSGRAHPAGIRAFDARRPGNGRPQAAAAQPRRVVPSGAKVGA